MGLKKHKMVNAASIAKAIINVIYSKFFFIVSLYCCSENIYSNSKVEKKEQIKTLFFKKAPYILFFAGK